MNNINIGGLIQSLRKERQMTQRQLADMLNVSDKAVSKWERGLGIPDISLVNNLAEIFKISTENLIAGNIVKNDLVVGNLKNTKFFICTICQNIILCTGNAEISCCGRKLMPQLPRKASEEDSLTIEIIEDEWFISANHPMTKEHYISFIAFSAGDSINLMKRYPEWAVDIRMPKKRHGVLSWYCIKHGLYYKLL